MEKGIGHPFKRFIRKHASKGESTSLEALMASTSGNGGDPLVNSEEFVKDDSSLLSLDPLIFKKESRMMMNMGVDKSKGSLRSRRLRRNCVEPVSSFMGNYITPQFDGLVEMEEYSLSSPPNSPTPILLPFVVTDSSRVISKSRFESVGLDSENGLFEEDLLRKAAVGFGCGVKGTVVGVPTLPESRRLKRKSNEFQRGCVENSNSRKPCKVLQLEGLHNGMLPLCIGISIGMMSALLVNRTEVEKLHKSLEQTEDLVRDLQDELEMKDSLSVKELACGTYETQKLKHWKTKIGENRYLKSCYTSRDECEHQHLDRAGENTESLSKMEAELEAELERLEQNINACNMVDNMSDFIELDPALIADVVHGELRADKLTTENLESLTNSRYDSNTTSTAHTYNANYSVSPKELSLRLHQVIQTRLEQRIEELENELHQNKQQLQVMEADITFSNSEMGFSSYQESPGETRTNPFCLHFSGDALNAYDEAYGEFMKMNREEENPVVSTDKGEEWIDGYKSNSSCTSLPWESILWSRGSTEILKNDEEDSRSGSFNDDEEGKVLIQQLVEKSKKGSIDLMNAQRRFLSMDEPVSREEEAIYLFLSMDEPVSREEEVRYLF